MNIIFFGYDAVGDYISYNGMIRHLAKNYDTVSIVTNFSSFNQLLFRDNDKIKTISFEYFNQLMSVSNDFDIIDVRIGEKYYKPINCSGVFYDKDNKIGDVTNQYVNDNASNFYSTLGLSISTRIDNFYFDRLLEQENYIFNRLDTEGGYSVICEYTDCLINKDYIKNDKIINLHRLSDDMLDIIKVIEESEEVHLVENSIALLVYHLQSSNLMKNVKVNLHAYSRKEHHRVCVGENCNNFYLNMLLYPKLKNWNIIYESN